MSSILGGRQDAKSYQGKKHPCLPRHVMPTRDDRKCLPTSAAGQFRGQRIPMHSQGYRRKPEGQPHFLIAPGNSCGMPTTTRNPSYSRWLYSLKKTRAPVDLLQALKLADGAHRCRNVGMIVGGMLCWSKLTERQEHVAEHSRSNLLSPRQGLESLYICWRQGGLRVSDCPSFQKKM